MDDYSLKTDGVYSKYSGGYVQVQNQGDEFSNGSLDFDGYLKLLVAQMSNQDFNDPMSDADLLNQMAQYSMLEGIKDMTQQSAISYAASLVGKIVTVSDGQYYHTGVVSSISVENGKPSVMVDGQAFESSDITDIVDTEEYNALRELLGKTVTFKSNTADSEDAVKGVVTGIVFLGGVGYVAVNGNTYPASLIKVIDDEEGGDNDSTEGTEGVEGEGGETGGTEGAEGSGDAAENGGVTGETSGSESNSDEDVSNSENPFKVGEVGENQAAASYAASADALTDMLMRELDRVDQVKSVNAAAEEYSEGFNLEEIMKTAYVQVPEYAAAAYGDMDSMVLSAVDGNTVYANGDSSVSGIGNVSISDYDRSTGTGTLVDDNYTEVIRDDTPSVTTTTYNNTSTSAYTASGKLKGVTAAAGIARGDGVPHRVSVEKYPEEAALADEYGTRMYDISQIHNHEVTSRIKTGPVITRTASGRGVTEVGYSGVGQLGEVVTFEDGTQRVEILLNSGKSTWLFTSGRYTLDQICTTNGIPGSLSDMTGAEKAIRHYSKANETQLRNYGYPV
ncbi:MAG: hypothetical protein K2G04_02670 [Oscillospiraceae bacterium]|nr:hypothetical protein [Oscillospiraceae bacterium]